MTGSARDLRPSSLRRSLASGMRRGGGRIKLWHWLVYTIQIRGFSCFQLLFWISSHQIRFCSAIFWALVLWLALPTDEDSKHQSSNSTQARPKRNQVVDRTGT